MLRTFWKRVELANRVSARALGMLENAELTGMNRVKWLFSLDRDKESSFIPSNLKMLEMELQRQREVHGIKHGMLATCVFMNTCLHHILNLKIYKKY